MRLARLFAALSLVILAMVGLVASSAASVGQPRATAARRHHRAARHHSARYLCAHHRISARRCGSLFDWRLPRHPRVLRNSAAIVSRIFNMGNGQIAPVQLNPAPGHDWGDAVFHSTPSDPVYRIHCDKPSPQRCPVEGWRIHIPARARPASGGDALMSVISEQANREYDFWNVQTVPLSRRGGRIVVGWAGYARLNDWGAGTGHSCGGGGSCTIMSKGLITYSDLKSGHINHAVYLVVGCGDGRTAYPAWRGNGGGGVCSDPTNAPAWGQWLQLNMSDRQINGLPVPHWLKAIYKAFAHYGGVVYDAGSSGAFDIQVESPETFTALDIRNPFIGWAAWHRRHEARSHVGAYVADGGRRYWLDFGGVRWASKLRVIAPCVIAGTC